MKKRPSTCVISSRISDITLAELHHFWTSQGERITSLSELVRTSCEGLRTVLSEGGHLGDQPSWDHHSARQYLIQHGLETKTMQNRNRRKHLQAIQVDQASSLFVRPEAADNCVSPEDYQKALAELSACLEDDQEEQEQAPEPDEADLRDQLLANIPDDVKKREEKE